MPFIEPSDSADYFNYKGGGGAGGTPGTPTIPGLPQSPLGGGGGGGAAYPSYDRGVPQFGYRRKPIGPVGNYRTAGAVSGQYGTPSGIGVNDPARQTQYAQAQPMAGQQQPDQWSPYANDQRGDINGAVNRIFGNAGRAGVFDPNGSQALLQQIASQYQGEAGRRQNQIANQMALSGTDDPNAYAYGSLNANLGAQHDLSQSQGNAQLQSMMQNQQFLQSMAGQLFGNNQANQMNVYNHTHQPQQKFNWGQLLGGLGGSALGGFNPMSMFGGGGGGQQQGPQNGDQYYYNG